MNHPDPPQPDPNDRSPETPRAGGESRGLETHFGQIISNVEGQIEQLHQVQSELDEHAIAMDARARELAARQGEAAGPRDEALAAVAVKLEARILEAGERYARLVEEHEAFDAERDEWVGRRQSVEANLQEREEELAQQERDFAEEREQLAAIAARVAEERAQQLREAQDAGGRLDEMTARCAELEQQLQVERERVERAETERAGVAEEVERERDEARAEADAAGARLAQLEQQKLAEQNKPADAAKVGTDVRVRAMKQKIQKLEALLAEKHPQVMVAPPATDQQQLDDMRRKAQRLSEVAEHLRRRHYRLRKARHLIKKRKPRPIRTGPDPRRAAAAAEQHADQVRRLETQRIALGEKAATLASAERRMVRKWAAARAAVLVGWIVATGVVAAASSWLAASQIVPPERSASVTIDARSRIHGALDEEQSADWRAWHTQIVADDGFLDALLIRMDERQIEAFADKAAINQRLSSDLTFAAVDNDTLILTLSGTDTDEVVTLLNLVASTIVVESGQRLRKRTAKPWATLGGSEARLNPTPIRDQRLPWAGGIFGGLYVVLILLGALIYTKLARVKREFDADGTLFDEIKPLSDGAVQNVAVI